MSVLSEEKILEIAYDEDTARGPVTFARAIEAAVLAELGKQEPVAHVVDRDNCKVWWSDKFTHISQAPENNTPLYAAPVVQPDVVLVLRESIEAMFDVAMNRYQHVSPEARLRFFQMHRENFRWDYRAMIAAAEGK